MDPQHVIDVCEANWDANKSDCNHFVKAVADALGVTLFTAGDDADAIMDKLSSSAAWSLIPSAPDPAVEAAAAAGQFIIAGLKSGDFTPPRAHGHVVVVVNGDDPNHPGYPLAYWGMLGGVGQKDSSIRNTFIPNVDLPNVKYFGTSLADALTASLEMSASSPDNLDRVKAMAAGLITAIADSLGKDPAGNAKDRVLFPNGIDSVEIELKSGPVEVGLKVAGPKSSKNV